MRLLTYIPHGIAVFGALVFLDSLRYKFTDHPNTQTIFGALDMWAESIGLQGLFSHAGIFSQYVIGSVELVAALCLLLGMTTRFRRLQAVGALLGLLVMSGAVSFHLFTPLGIDPNNDGGGLFIAAALLWVLSLVLLGIRRKELFALAYDIGRALFGKHHPSSV